MRQLYFAITTFFILSCSELTVGQSFSSIDTLAFENTIRTLRGQNIDTSQEKIDSLLARQDSIVIDFFCNAKTFNYSFKTINESHGHSLVSGDGYSFISSKQLQLLMIDNRSHGSFYTNKTYIRYKGTFGKIGIKIIDGVTTGETEDNLWYTNIYKLRSNSDFFLLVGSGTGCNSCFFYGARLIQLIGDDLILTYPGFSDKSFLVIQSDSYESTFKFDQKTQTISYNYTTSSPSNKEKKIKGKYKFNGKTFKEK